MRFRPPEMLLALVMTTAMAATQNTVLAEVSVPTVSLHTAPPDAYPHPDLSTDDGWAKEMVLVILLGLFLPAAIVGPWIRKRVASEMPELHDQEEQSGLTASQHEPGHTKPLI